MQAVFFIFFELITILELFLFVIVEVIRQHCSNRMLLQQLGNDLQGQNAPHKEGDRCIMKHVSKCETLNVFLYIILVFLLVFFPLFQNISFAQSQDITPPYISHHPAKIAILGKPINVVAHIFDDSQIESVTITITLDGQTQTGQIPKRQTYGTVPVVAKALEEILIYKKADDSSTVKGIIAQDETVDVTRVNGQYYRIATSFGVAGYVKASDCQIDLEGALYGVAIPANMTFASELLYEISAKDIFGNVAKSGPVSIRILDEKDILALRSGVDLAILQGPQLSQKDKGGFGMAKVVFLTGVAIAGGGAYYIYSQNNSDEKDEKATIGLVLSWD